MTRWWVVVAVLCAAARAQAAPPANVRIVSAAGGCPAPAVLAAALEPLLPDSHVVIETSTGEAAADAVVVTVTDLGDVFRIEVSGQQRTIADTTRDCSERAATAAVAVAFVLDPPAAGSPEPGPVPVPLPLPVLLPLPLAPPLWELDAAGMFAFAPQGTHATGGAAAQLAIGRGWLAGEVGIAAFGPVTMPVGSGAARLIRVPVLAGLRARTQRGGLELAAEVDAVAGALFVRGEQITHGASTTTSELGARAAARLELRRARWSPYAALEASVVARHDLVLDGTTQPTPMVWVGVAVGVDALRF